MEQINLPEFLSLFGCTRVDDCWLNTDCVIDKSGITAKYSDDDSTARLNYSERVKLSFPCTTQQIFDWAQTLDSWERFNAVGNQNHVVEKLPKEIVDKWQPVNELYRGWCDAKGVIRAKIGTEPCDVNWDYWLSLPKWTKKEAALLISGLEPDKFHLVERLADYESMCEPLVKLLRKIPDDLAQCPLDWLNWFDEIGNLMYARKPLRVWFEQQSGISALQAEAMRDDGAGSQESKDGQQRIGINGDRDLDAANWYKTKKPEEVEKMTVKQIHTELKARDTNRTAKFWHHGFTDWNRTQRVYPKKKPGRKSGK